MNIKDDLNMAPYRLFKAFLWITKAILSLIQIFAYSNPVARPDGNTADITTFSLTVDSNKTTTTVVVVDHPANEIVTTTSAFSKTKPLNTRPMVVSKITAKPPFPIGRPRLG